MKKDKKERYFFDKFISFVDEIEDDQFEDKDFVRETIVGRMRSGQSRCSYSSVDSR